MCEGKCHDSNATWFSCTMCKYKCKKPNTLARHYASKHEVVVSEKEPDNNSKMNAPDKETKIAQNKKHHHKGDTSIIQETLFKENPEDRKSIEFVNTHTTNCNDSMTESHELTDFKLDKSQKSYISSEPKNIEQKQDT